jgi:nucleotide-binding universal stress UspA family protein
MKEASPMAAKPMTTPQNLDDLRAGGNPSQREAATGAVVAGVDGSPGALVAARWAATEAAGRDLPLRLVFAVDPASDAGSRCQEATTQSRVRFAEDSLAEAARQARTVGGSIEITLEAVHDSPAAALAHGVNRAAMICLGSNGVRPAHPGHRTGTATEVLLTADCPVAVVRGPAPDYGWVVAWVEAEPTLFDTLNLAVSEAVLRGLPLRLLTPVGGADPSGDTIDLDRRLRRDLDRWRQRYPHLDAVVVGGSDLDEFLVRNGHRIALFVAQPRRAHDVGTVVHPSAESAVRLLSCPLIISAGAAGLSGGPPSSTA